MKEPRSPLTAACLTVLVHHAALQTCTTPAQTRCVTESRDAAVARVLELAGSPEAALEAMVDVALQSGGRVFDEYELGGAS